MHLLRDAERYEPVGGRRPAFLQDEHQDGVHVALTVLDSPYDRAGVWDRRTGTLVWTPSETQAACWLPGGREIVLVREGRAAPLDEAAAAAWPLGSDGVPSPCFAVERRTWPGRELRSVCAVDAEDCNWSGGVAASPRGDLVAVVWLEQHAGGFELVAVRAEGDRQVPGGGYHVEPNRIGTPVFSPDGRHLVVGCGAGFSWWNQADNPDQPSPGGRFRLGHLLVRDLDAGGQQELPIEVVLPAGWLPHDPTGRDVTQDLPIGDAVFDRERTFVVDLLTDEHRRFTIQDGPRLREEEG